MNGYSVKLHLIALHKYLEAKGYIVLDALCAKSFDYVALNKDGSLIFIYANLDDYIFPSQQLFEDVSKWFYENPAYESSYSYEIYTINLTSETRAKIRKMENYL